MPTNRKRVSRKIAKTPLSDYLRAYLETGQDITTDLLGRAKAEIFMLRKGGDRLHKAWALHRDAILPGWIRENPCTRPWTWWVCDAPQEPVKCHVDAGIEEAQRKRLGGIGTPTFEVLSCGLGFPFGIPTSWIDQWECDYYNGRAKDIHGKPIDQEFKERDFDGVAFDENDPPTFESEAVYLQRHGFLSDTEKAYLEKHPGLLEPEKVEFEED
jgi:hypothetical protein